MCSSETGKSCPAVQPPVSAQYPGRISVNSSMLITKTLTHVDFIARLLRLDTFNQGDCKAVRKLLVGKGRDREFESNVANFRHLWKCQLRSWIKTWIRHTSRCRFRIEDGEGRITQQTNLTTATNKTNIWIGSDQ